jgi:hypothetical protein
MDDNPLAKAAEAAEFLSLKAMTLYCQESGTDHLRKLKLGKSVRWYWPQIRAHREQIIKMGKCEGECEKVFEELEKPEQLSPFSLVKTR